MMKILFVASEALPFAATGGLADVAGSLPQALTSLGADVRVVIPMYSSILQDLRQSARFVGSVTVPLSWRQQYCGVFEVERDGVCYYLLDNEQYFKRETLYGQPDDVERFAFFSKATLEMLPLVDFKPDVVHSNDWHTGLVSPFYRAFYEGLPFYSGMRHVFTIHNIQYQGQMPYFALGDLLGMSQRWLPLLEYGGCLNSIKGAVEAADAVTTVSPTYAQEIRTPIYGHGLHGILDERSHKLSGILNGIDVASHNPETDKQIAAIYSAGDTDNKAVNKSQLQRIMGLVQDAESPLIAMVTRLTEAKGIDLVVANIEELVTQGVQFTVLGSGDFHYETYFKELSAKYPGRVAAELSFKPDLARCIYAGADMFLMPSRTEACGLAQMIALRYGTPPIVHSTGGLRDTVSDANGFPFSSYSAEALRSAVDKACSVYRDKPSWHNLVKKAMKCDFSWNKSAVTYMQLYKSLIKG